MQLVETIIQRFGAGSVAISNPDAEKITLNIKSEILFDLVTFLRTDSNFYFDYLSCITGVDNKENGTLEVIYTLYSIPFDKHLNLKLEIPNPGDAKLSKEVQSIAEIHRSANWLEREVYDMFGIPFSNHPDLRRILLPADWIGFPLRKDYETSEKYHGITIDYKEES